MKKHLSIFFTAALGGVLALGINNYVSHNSVSEVLKEQQTAVKYVNYPASLPETSINFVQAADISVHAVVHVKTTYNNEQQDNMPFGYDPFRDFFFGDNGRRAPIPQMASGSGVIISGDGYIVTNNHVIDRADKIEVTLNDKRTYTADLVGADPTTDIALLKIKEDKLPYLVYGNSDDLKVGEWVLAVGNPFNLTSTVTAGIVSAKGRNINMLDNQSKGAAIESFIQTDAAVNPGNSGGALVTSGGQLIGINTAIASNTGSYSGYSFAVPVNIVKKVVNDLLEFGKVQRAFMGVGIRDIDSRFAADKKIENLKGIYITGVTESGAASEAGIKEGDIITKIGAVETNNTSSLLEQISRFRPGDKVEVTVKRNGIEKVIPLVLKNKNGEAKLVTNEKAEATSVLGALFEPVSAPEKNKLGISNGLKITALEAGKLRSAGIKEGFIILSIDKKKINTAEELNNIIENRTGGILIEGIYPNGMRAYYAFGL